MEEPGSTLRPMPRALPIIQSKYPMHAVESSSRIKDKAGNTGGITFSLEKPTDEDTAKAERDVLRSILLRESYLERLRNVVRTIAKKFKPEVADVLDLIRSASLDVIESIEAWRKLKDDPNATFVWNGINYLLKMPSDLDYLSEYVAVQKWMGFPLTRNPFCIPYAMDLNPEPIIVHDNTDALLAPQHVAGGLQQVEGFTIGGPLTAQPQALTGSFSGDASTEQQALVKKTSKKKKAKGGDWRSNPVTEAQSFILNEDMKRIRRAEALIMKAETQFGKFMRDPEGNLVPYMQALTRKAALELKKDDKRPLNEPAVTSLVYAPHAAKSDVGIADAAWTPDLNSTKKITDVDDLQKRAAVPPRTIEIPNADGTQTTAIIEGQDPNSEEGKYINSRQRGAAQIGGELLPLHQRGSESRRRRPIKPSVSSEMDFQRNRKMLALEARLQEIRKLKEELNRSSSAGGLLENNDRSHGVVRSTLSGQRLGVSKSAAAITTAPDPNPLGTSLNINEGKSGMPHDYFGNVEGAMSGHGLRPQEGQPYLDPAINPNTNLAMTSDNKQPKVQAIAKESVSSPGSASNSVQGMSIRELRKLRKLPNASQSVDMSEADDSSVTSPKSLVQSVSRSLSGKRVLPSIKSSKSSVSPSQDDQVDTRSEEEQLQQQLQLQLQLQLEEAKRKEKERELTVEEAKALRHHDHYQGDIIALGKLKSEERDLRAKENSLQIERKRRLLSQSEGKRVGPPPEDLPNVYDFYAVRIQSAIRGWLARCWIRWYRSVLVKATVLIQAIMRGWLARVRVRRLRRRHNAAVAIQKTFRGWSTRGTSAEMARKQSLFKMAIVIQRVWRGFLGRRRAKNKNALDNAAKQAFEAVDPTALVASDVKELGRRITYALDEPLSTTLPPDEVLDLIRLTVMVVQAGRGPLGIADYDNLQIRNYQELHGATLNWRQAGKILNRSERFIRLVRVVAYGCGAKPPRLIQLSEEGNRLFAAQANNPYWNITTFETMGSGSRICCQLFKWLSSMVEVSKRQQEFLALIATAFPDWLPKLQEQQRIARMCEFELEMNRRAYAILDSSLDLPPDENDPVDEMAPQIIEPVARKEEGEGEESDLDDEEEGAEDARTTGMAKSQEGGSTMPKRGRRVVGHIADITQREMKLLRRAMNESRARLRTALGEIDLIKKDQNSREVVALDSMNIRVTEANELLSEMAKQFAVAQELANAGDRAALEQCAELKVKLTNQRLKAMELEAQAKLLEAQVESNKAKRSDGGSAAKLTPEILRRVIIAGESRAAYLLSSIQCQTMLKNANVKHATDLPFHLFDIYDALHSKSEYLRGESRKRYVEAENEKKAHDDFIQSTSAAQEVAEQKSKDRMMPTDEEMREDRDEDELESRFEKQKHLQYLPDHILYEKPVHATATSADSHSTTDAPTKTTTFRPVMIALSRDLPALAKQRILREIRVKLPGRFVVIDPPSQLAEDTFDPDHEAFPAVPVIGEQGFEGTFHRQSKKRNRQPKKARQDHVAACQAVLDAGRHIITFVNHGLTRLTRDTFLNSLEILLQALYPRPTVVLVVGDEGNSRRAAFVTLDTTIGAFDAKLLEDYRIVNKLLQHECGVSPSDIQRMPNVIDREIKGALQTQAHIALRFLYERALTMACTTAFQYEPQRRLPPSHHLALVLEALYILLNEDKSMTDDQLPAPSHDRVAVSWRLTKLLLASPQTLAVKLQQLRRGSISVRRLSIIKMLYRTHPLWPNVANRAEAYSILYESPITRTIVTSYVPPDDFDSVRVDANGRPIDEDAAKLPSGWRSQRGVSDVVDSRHQEALLPAFAKPEIVTNVTQANTAAQTVGMSIEMAVKLLCEAFCEFIDALIHSEEATLAGGGVPLQAVTLKNSMQGVSTVVTVGDGTRTRPTSTALHSAAHSVDAEQACSQILRATLQDKRVLKTVSRLEFHSPMSINNGTITSSSLRLQSSTDNEKRYGIAMYRDQDRIFVEAYDADTQYVYITSIPIVEVPSLLMPSHSDTKDDNNNIKGGASSYVPLGPPNTAEEMYHRLMKLLRFEALSSDRRKSLNMLSGTSITSIAVRTRELVCRRDHSLLFQCVRVVQGHRCLIRVYTAGPGDVLITVYLTEYSRTLRLYFGVAERQRLALNYHDFYHLAPGGFKDASTNKAKTTSTIVDEEEDSTTADADDNTVEFKLLLETTHNVDAILPLPRHSLAEARPESDDGGAIASGAGVSTEGGERRPRIPIEREVGQGGGDIRTLIPFLLDRLQIHPPRHFIAATYPQNPYGKDSEFYTGAIEPVRVSSTAMILRDDDNHKNNNNNNNNGSSGNNKTNGHQLVGSAASLQLGMRLQGTSGRILFRSTFQIGHIRCILQVKEVSASQRMWISLYEPHSRHTMSLLVEPFHRHALLSEPLILQREGTSGHSRDRIIAWKTMLQERLRLHWWDDNDNGNDNEKQHQNKTTTSTASGPMATMSNPSNSTDIVTHTQKKPSPSQRDRESMRYGRISLDDTMVRRVITVQGVRYQFAIACSQEHEVTMTLYDFRSSKHFECKISPHELRVLIHTQTAAEIAQQAAANGRDTNEIAVPGRDLSHVQPARVAKNLDFMRGVVEKAASGHRGGGAGGGSGAGGAGGGPNPPRTCCYVHDLLCHTGHMATLCQKLSWYLAPVTQNQPTTTATGTGGSGGAVNDEMEVKMLHTKTPPCPVNIIFRERSNSRPKVSPVPKPSPLSSMAHTISPTMLAKQGTGLDEASSMALVLPSERSWLALRPYYRNLYPLHLQRLQSLHPKDPIERIREEAIRKQLYAIVRMEDELNAMALYKEQEAQAKLVADTTLATTLFQPEENNNSGGGDDYDHEMAKHLRLQLPDAVVEYGVGVVMDELVRNVALRVLKLNPDGSPANDPNAPPGPTPAPLYPIMTKKPLSQETMVEDTAWTTLLDVGVKANFRDGRVTWQAHVSMAIHRTLCWSTHEGLSCRYKFVVYDPPTAQYYEGLIRDVKHLREVLGIYGKDLLVTPSQIKAVGDLTELGDKKSRDPRFEDPFEVPKPYPEALPSISEEGTTTGGEDERKEDWRMHGEDVLPPREEEAKEMAFGAVTKSAQILRHRQREQEMVLFICRHRLELVTNKKPEDAAAAMFGDLSVDNNTTAKAPSQAQTLPQPQPASFTTGGPTAAANGAVSSTDAAVLLALGNSAEEAAAMLMAPYHVEFRADRLYSSDKITPVNAGTEEDDAINNQNDQKLVDIEHARGKKIVRLVRRVSGLLLQLTVFELPGDVARAAMIANPVPGYEHLLSEDGPIPATLPEKSNALTKHGGFDESRLDPEHAGFAEQRGTLDTLIRYLPPAFRIVGYDPRSKKKVVLAVPPQAVLEVCGGPFSPYLDPEVVEKRRYLARVVCESLILYFPASGQFQLVVPWSGSRHLLSNAEVSAADTKKNAPIGSVRSSAERVLQRSGRIFRAVVKVSKYELLLSLYTHRMPRKDHHSRPGTRGSSPSKPDGSTRKKKKPPTTTATGAEEDKLPDYVRLTAESLEEEARRARGELVEEGQDDDMDDDDATEELLIFNFYSPAVSQAAELVVDEAQQRERHPQQRLLLSFPEGAVRSTVIRRFVREFVNAEIIEDLVDPTQKTLHVALRDPRKGYVTDYQTMGIATPGDDLRPVGIPDVFFPLDTCGLPVHRRGMRLENLHYPSTKPAYKDVLITVYTKSKMETPERGFVIKIYDRSDCQTAILHIGASELIRLCNFHREQDLLRDLVTAQEDERSFGTATGTASSTLVVNQGLQQQQPLRSSTSALALMDDNASIASQTSSVLTVGRPVPVTAVTLALDKDDISRAFSAFTEQGDREARTKSLRDLLVDIVLRDLAFFIGPQDQVVPCIKSHPMGTAGLVDK